MCSSLFIRICASHIKMVSLMTDIRNHLSGKELFIRFTARAFRKLLSIYVFSYFPFGFEGRICDLIVSVLVITHLFTFYFSNILPIFLFLALVVLAKRNL